MDDQWTDIHPLHDALPFWQRDVATLRISCAPRCFTPKDGGLSWSNSPSVGRRRIRATPSRCAFEATRCNSSIAGGCRRRIH